VNILKDYKKYIYSIISFFVIILFLAISLPVFAQFTPIQNGYLNRNELLKNPDAEQGNAEWINSTGVLTTIDGDYFSGSRSFQITLNNEILSFCQNINTTLKLQNAMLAGSCKIKTSNPNIQVCNNVNGTLQDCQNVSNSGFWEPSHASNNFSAASSSSGLCVISTVPITTAVKIDDCSLDEEIIPYASFLGNVLTSNGKDWISKPLPLSINTLNTLNTTKQYFATSTDGTNFSITSSVNTHTFNLPEASAVTTGKLTSSDWLTFYGKEPAITILPVSKGGTGSSNLTLNNVILGNGTSPVQYVAAGAVGNVLTSNGSTWVSSPATGGGGSVSLFNSSDLTLTSSDQIALSTVTGDVIQKWRVQGGAGAITLLNTPFLGSVADGTEIILVGNDNTNTVQFTSNDIAGGCVLNGTAILQKYYSLTLVYDQALNRFIEKSRNF
jgi:hypothetical protein